MAGIRVSWIPYKCTEKEIRIHFSKPENRGGPIQSVYYPLFNNDAVIIFEDPNSIDIDNVTNHRHRLMGEKIFVEALPYTQVFTEMEAKLDPSVAALLQVTDEVRDEIQYHRNVEFCFDKDKSLVGVRGNWYLLEWVWAYIERITLQQGQTQKYQYQTTTKFQTQTQTQTQPRPPSPGELSHPIISLPSATSSLSSLNEKPAGIVKQARDSATAEVKRNYSDIPLQTDSKRDKTNYDSPIRRKDSLVDEDDDSNEKLAGLTLSGNEENVSEITILNDKPEDVRSLDFRYGPLSISVYSGFITMAETEAIVNAAMGCMINAGGVARAIADAAGAEMQRQCDEYVQKYGDVPTTEVIHTCAGGKISLNVKYVLHAVGPVYSATRERECASQLTQTFLNCMIHGNDVLKIQSITMPVISSGIFGCPLEICVRSFLNAVLLFSSDHMSDTVHLKEVNLVNNNNDNTAMTVLQLRKLISQETQGLVLEAQQQIQQTEEEDYRVEKAVRKTSKFRDYDTGSLTTQFRTDSALMSDKTSPLTRVAHHSSLLPGNQTHTRFDTDNRYRDTSPSTITSPGYSLGSMKSEAGLSVTRASSFEPRATQNVAFEKNSLSPSSRLLGKTSSMSVDRDFGASESHSRDGRSDITGISKTRKSGPPTTSILYSEERVSLGTRKEAAGGSIPRTTGRPLPAPPMGTSKYIYKH